MTTSVLFIRCRRCGKSGRIEVKEVRRTCEQQARREGWVRTGPGSWECPDCWDRIQDARYDKEEQNADD